MKILMCPYGSAGDVHPFIGIGLALRQRGHQVIFISPHYFVPLLDSHGFESRTIGEPGQFEAALVDPDLWHPTKSLRAVSAHAGRGVGPVYDIIRDMKNEGLDAVVCGGLAFGARTARDKLGVPLATVHLQPAVFWSVEAMPVMGDMAIPRWLPRPLKRAFFGVASMASDRTFAPPVNAHRAEVGLPNVRRIFHRWWHSPDLVLAMFPEWYAPIQSDWPPNTVQAGFPLYDEADVSPLDPDLLDFLDRGSPPIVFAPGSANRFAHGFFAESASACERLGRRGILATKFADQIPEDLPEGVRHFAYIPFSTLLPRAAALVHHGGIGTAAQGMAAGIPHLVRPLAHDQFDNADRLERLGIGRSLRVKRYREPAVSRTLADLLENEHVARTCRTLADRIRAEHPIDVACKAIESLSGA